jgi:hypothetical protein
MEFTPEELKLLELYLLCELDTQRYEVDGIDKNLEELYAKIRDHNNLTLQVHSIMEHLKTV